MSDSSKKQANRMKYLEIVICKKTVCSYAGIVIIQLSEVGDTMRQKICLIPLRLWKVMYVSTQNYYKPFTMETRLNRLFSLKGCVICVNVTDWRLDLFFHFYSSLLYAIRGVSYKFKPKRNAMKYYAMLRSTMQC